jgi:alkaline phosphatase D
MLADSAWSIRLKPEQRVPAGAHGYDPANKNMHAIFCAAGPAFRKNLVIPGFENTDLYLIITRILGLNPAPVDGKPERIEAMFNTN